jgi:hypothetical protein
MMRNHEDHECNPLPRARSERERRRQRLERFSALAHEAEARLTDADADEIAREEAQFEAELAAELADTIITQIDGEYVWLRRVEILNTEFFRTENGRRWFRRKEEIGDDDGDEFVPVAAPSHIAWGVLNRCPWLELAVGSRSECVAACNEFWTAFSDDRMARLAVVVTTLDQRPEHVQPDAELRADPESQGGRRPSRRRRPS